MNINTKKSYGGHIAIKILFVVFFLLCANTLFAQIQTKILGCELGVSTLSDVEKVLNERGLQFTKNAALYGGEGYYYHVRQGVAFGGEVWGKTTFCFIGGKLWYVAFEKEGYGVLLMDTYAELAAALEKKYGRYYERTHKGEIPNNITVYYSEGHTELYLSHHTSFDERSGYLHLEYSIDKSLLQKTKGIDDL